MALVGHISGSSQSNSVIGVSGSVIVANRPQDLFPSMPGTDTTFFVSGSKSTGDRAVFGGSVVISGSLNVEGTLSIPGVGDVTGPGSSLDNQIVVFDGLTGKAIKAPGNAFVNASGDITGSNLVLNSNSISGSAGGNLFLGSAGDVTVAGDLTITGNDIKASNGNTNITLTSNTLTTFAGDIKVTGNDIQASDGNPALTFTGTGNVTVPGDLAVNGPTSADITTTTTTATVFNTTATTVSVGGAATTQANFANGNVTSGTQTINIAAGGTSNGTTKAINIGSGTATNSTTTVQIGPTATAGGTITLNPTIGYSGVAGTTTVHTPAVTLGNTSTGTTTINSPTISAAATAVNLTATSAATITHTGGTGNLTITSTNSNVVVEGTTFNGNDVTVPGDIAVNGGDITTTTAGTFNLVNANATTVNLAGAATSLNLGAATGTTTVNNTLVVSKDLLVNGTMTTIDTTNLEVKDQMIGLGFSTGSVAVTNGDRGWIGGLATGGVNVMNKWDNGNSEFAFATTTSSTSGSYAVSAYSNLHAAKIQGTIVSASLGFSGSLTQLVDGTSYLIAGSNISITSASNGPVTISTSANVVGPGSATDGAVALFDGTTGKLIKNSSLTTNGAGTSLYVNSDLYVSGSVTLGDSSSDKVAISGSINTNVLPDTDAFYNLGSPDYRWANVYTGDLHLRNDRGNWTMIEEENYLTIRNNNTGKVFRLLMEEVLTK